MSIQRKLRGAEPTVVKRNTQEANETSSTTSTTTEILPVVMVGVASAVIACAVMLYLTDMRDRCRISRSDNRVENASHKQVHLSLTRTGTSGSSNMSALYPVMLPPFPRDDDDAEDMEMVIYCVPPKQISLSRMSTMTSTLVEGNVWEGRAVPYDNSQAAVDGVLLSETNRVGDRTDLGTLVQSADKQMRKIAVMSSSPVV
jgi:hypothetical protein